MGSNHGNLFNDLIILVRECYVALHVIMNSTGVGVGVEDGSGTGAGRSGCDETGEAVVGRGKQCMVDDTRR